MFHISDVKKYSRCPKMFYNSLHEPVNSFMRYIRVDEALTELAMQKLKVENYFLGQRNDPSSVAMEASKNNEWLIKARFEAENCRVKIPLMHKTEEGWDLYFILTAIYPKEDDMQYYCNNVWVLNKLGFKINNIYILHLNKDYIREAELNVDQLFVIGEDFYNANGNPVSKVTKTIKDRIQNLTPVLKEMEQVAALDEFEAVKSKKCIKRNRCSYYDVCFPNEKKLEDDSVMTLVSSQYKNEMFQEGIRLLKDIPLNRLEGSRQQYAQVMASRKGGQFVDKSALKTWINNQLVEPLSFLDFEWETYAIPPFVGLKPFDVVCFQYSLHMLKEDQSLIHKEFLGVHDCREEFILRLIQDLPKSGSILAYNGEGAEKLRLIELAEQFPQYKDELLSICDRIVDLSIPFMNGLVYDIRMKGFYSLKVLLSVFDNELKYSDLDISHGMDAVFKWRSMDKDESENKEIEQQLMEYCGLDTLAMVIVLDWLKKQVED